MQRILFVGCGDIAMRTARLLAPRTRCYGLIRSPERADELRRAGLLPIFGDLDQPHTLRRLAGLATVVVHLAPPAAAGRRDHRTRHLLQALTRRGSLPQGTVYISTSGVYGDCRGEWVSETRRLTPATDRACRRVDAEVRLRGWARRHGVALAILRVPGIYARDRLPVSRLQQGVPALRPEEDGFTNHIHADDLARAILRTLGHLDGIRSYHIVDDSRLKMGDYFDLVADSLALPRPERIARSEAEGRISATMLTFIDESRRLINRRMHEELRLTLRYPTVADGLAACRAGD